MKCPNMLAPPLHHILHLSLEQGTYPEQWKTAVVSPIFKQKGNRSDPKFYRPISLLPSVSKVFERLVHRQLMEFCFENTVFPDCQYGFLPKRSTVWQLLSITNDWAQTIDHGKRVHACFLNVAKAFDGVHHNILEVKLSSIGVRAPASNGSVVIFVDGRSAPRSMALYLKQNRYRREYLRAQFWVLFCS